MPNSRSALSPNLSRNRMVTKPSVRTMGGIVVAHNRNACKEPPFEHSFPFTIASAARREAGMNEGATEPRYPWLEVVSEDGSVSD